MYQQSKKMLVFLAVALLASTIASGVMTVMETMGISAGKLQSSMKPSST
jgi:hypothetical protein